MWRKGNPHTLLVGMYIGAATVEYNMEVFEKTKNIATIWPRSSTSRYKTKTTKALTWKDASTPMFIAALLTTAKMWKEAKVHMMDKAAAVYIHNRIFLNHTKNEISPLATTWMDLEGIVLSEISQTEKDKYYMTVLIYVI